MRHNRAELCGRTSKGQSCANAREGVLPVPTAHHRARVTPSKRELQTGTERTLSMGNWVRHAAHIWGPKQQRTLQSPGPISHWMSRNSTLARKAEFSGWHLWLWAGQAPSSSHLMVIDTSKRTGRDPPQGSKAINGDDVAMQSTCLLSREKVPTDFIY